MKGLQVFKKEPKEPGPYWIADPFPAQDPATPWARPQARASTRSMGYRRSFFAWPTCVSGC